MKAIRSSAWGLAMLVSATSMTALTACSAAPTDSTQAAGDELAMAQDVADPSILEAGGAHQMPLHEPATRSAQAVRPAASGAHLTYYGGKVVSNAKLVKVQYGGGTYASFVSSASAPSLATFYGQVTSSVTFDMLTEYDTPTQAIGHGSFSKAVSITPATSRNGATISDASIKAEISAQITKGTLPAPDANTIFMVSFPKGKHISQGGSKSCVAGGFCAYHGTFKRNGQEVYYAVLPDMSAGSGCDTGCGGGTPFANQTSVASHELVETVTDAEVGLATVVGPPLAWYDANNGEIGDICNGQQGTIAGSDGHTYTVQKEWSNAANACIVHR